MNFIQGFFIFKVDSKEKNISMIGWRFGAFRPEDYEGSTFEKLLKIFQELLVYTSGNVSEALSWLTQLDKEYELTDENYGMADFIQDLIEQNQVDLMTYSLKKEEIDRWRP